MIRLMIPVMAAATVGAFYVLSRRRKLEFEVEMKLGPQENDASATANAKEV